MDSPAPPRPDAARWTAARLFSELRALGRLRVISTSGPSVFEAICRVGAFEIASGHLNIISDAYHWHLGLARFGHLQSHDRVHTRSGRRVLFFELREQAEATPFLRIYLYRPPQSEFEPDALARFGKLHESLAAGVPITERAGEPR